LGEERGYRAARDFIESDNYSAYIEHQETLGFLNNWIVIGYVLVVAYFPFLGFLPFILDEQEPPKEKDD
jgi:hypothetical protein